MSEEENDTSSLRLELKRWEKDFSDAHGRKAGRDDIKSDATIAAKYKEYAKSQRASAKPQHAETPRKQKPAAPLKDPLGERQANRLAATPRKTPSKVRFTSLHLPAPSPVQEIEPTPAFIRCALGPTPQKDGEVLGIFDLPLSGTPCRADHSALAGMGSAVKGTPSKAAPTSSDAGFSRTPQSSSKRFFLDAFAGTPLKRKREDDAGTSSASKRRFATPSFLRRSFPLGPIAEDADEVRPTAPPFGRRGLVRSLSTIIQGLKKQEKQQMDDEWDILNELEEEEQGISKPAEKPAVVVVENSQGVEMPLGPDQADESAEEQPTLDNHDPPRKPWKKKGLKRQTRRVIMRPVVNKPGKAADAEGADESEPEVVAETQIMDAFPDGDGDDTHTHAEFEACDSDSDDEAVKARQRTSKAAKKKQTKKSKAASDAKKPDQADEPGRAKKPRKVSAQAHANFRKLKIKSKNAKPSGRGGGRFGRR